MKKAFGFVAVVLSFCMALSACMGGKGGSADSSLAAFSDSATSFPSSDSDSSEDSLSAGPAGSDNEETGDSVSVGAEKKILILESGETASGLSAVLQTEGFMAETVLLGDTALPETPESLYDLYDQVILNDVFLEELPEGFGEILYSYVYDFGGGLLTAGDNSDVPMTEIYDGLGPENAALKELLPVEAAPVQSSLGLILLVDLSGSMSLRVELVKQVAQSCLNALSDRDRMGIMTFSEDSELLCPLTGVAESESINKAIEEMEAQGGGTIFSAGITRAGELLEAETDIYKRHIILITDGAPGEPQEEYFAATENNYRQKGITMSVLLLAQDAGDSVMEQLAEAGGGTIYADEQSDYIAMRMNEELNRPELREYGGEPFRPLISDPDSPLLEGVEYTTDERGRCFMTPELRGFCGAAAKSDAEVILSWEFGAPLYVRRALGKGVVGSFLFDLYGGGSAQFLTGAGGIQFVCNAVLDLLPGSSQG